MWDKVLERTENKDMSEFIEKNYKGGTQAVKLTKEQAEALRRWLNSEGTIEDREVLVKLLGV